MNNPKGFQISRISVEKLFGRYTYNLDLSGSDNEQGSRMAILYGDNGTGKTTILKLLFHLLSSATLRGHKTFLARTPLKALLVQFTDGTALSISRSHSSLTGTFELHLSREQKELRATYVATDDNRVVSDDETPEREAVESHWRDLGLSVFLLSDSRTLESDALSDHVGEHVISDTDITSEEVFYRLNRREGRRMNLDQRDIAVRESLNRVTQWVRDRMFEQSSQGELNALQIYANVIASINTGAGNQENYRRLKKRLTVELRGLEDRSNSFTNVGLIPTIRVEPMLRELDGCTEDTVPVVAQVVRSFLDGQTARLDAVEPLNKLLNRFIDLINGFLRDKDISLNVATGVRIISDLGTELSPEHLSSGEKQLLLLFANVLMASSAGSIFIVDEPELSLNVKWQRLLLDALLEITQGSNCQFLLATHSIELLSKHRNRVIQLTPERPA